MATHSSFLAWRIPWTEEPATQSMGSQLIRHDRSDLAHMHAFRDKQEPFIRGIPLIKKHCVAFAPYQWEQNLERHLQLSPSKPSHFHQITKWHTMLDPDFGPYTVKHIFVSHCPCCTWQCLHVFQRNQDLRFFQETSNYSHRKGQPRIFCLYSLRYQIKSKPKVFLCMFLFFPVLNQVRPDCEITFL